MKELPREAWKRRGFRLGQAHRAWLRRRNLDWLIIGVLLAIAAIPLVVNIGKPLWFDEVWRAHIISSWRLYRYDGEAPLPLLFMVLTKLVTLVYNNEFTQRIVYSLLGLGLIPLLYLFGREIRSRKFGLLLAASLPFTIYYLEYLIENKVFLTDIVVTVIFIWLFKKYLGKRLALRWVIGFGVVYMISSTSSVYLFAAAGLWQAWLAFKHQDSWRRLLGWTIPLGVVYIIYYVTFLHPQITPGLLQFWQIDQWRGQPVGDVLKYVAKDVLATFGFDISQLWPNIAIDSLVFESGMISYHAMSPLLLQFTWVFGAFVIIWFVVGARSLVRRGWGFIPFSIVVVWVLSFMLSYFAIAPFGNNRADLFLFALMAITAWLGLYEILAWLWHRNSEWAQGILVGIVVCSAWFIPLDALKNRLITPRAVYYLDGMPVAAKIVRKESKPQDLVVNFQFMNEQSFLYYYNYATPIRKLNNRPSENLLFDRQKVPLADSPDFYRRVSEKYQTVWVVWGAGIGHDPTDNARGYFTVDERGSAGFVGVAKLTKN